MVRLLFAITLALYGFSAMDIHEWVRVPQVVVHLLEHHSDLGHHDEESGEHHGDDHDHDPFGEDCHGAFCACGGLIAIAHQASPMVLSAAPLTSPVGMGVRPVALSAHAGNVWNPPKA